MFRFRTKEDPSMPDHNPQQSVQDAIGLLQQMFPGAVVDITIRYPGQQQQPQPPPPAQPAGQASATPGPAPAPVPVSRLEDRNQRTDPERTYSGRLVYAGMAKRTQYDRTANKARTFEQFCIDLDDGHGAPERIWGVDLQRAVHEAGAQLGQQVVVEHLGKSGRKNRYRVIVRQ